MPTIIATRSSTRVVVASRLRTVVDRVDGDQVSVVDAGVNLAPVQRDTRVVGATAIGVQGPKGDAGTNAGEIETKSYVSDHPGILKKGMPVCLIGGMLRRATCVAPYNKVIGLVFEEAITQGESGRVQTDGLMENTALAWNDATGMLGGLAAGSTYYLTENGDLTPFAPSTLGQFFAPVGTAMDNTTLRIELNTQILL